METYKGKINEFVDWLSGNDLFTNRNVSGNLPISGASIRELIQSRLKKPIIVYEDEKAGLFRLFSSEIARDRWISGHNPQDPAYDPENTDDLEIFNFERPSDFILSTDLTDSPRYIIKGDNASSEAEVVFKVNLKDKEGQTKSDSITVTYTITNNITGITKSFSEPYSSSYVNNSDNKVRFNLYDHLLDGINQVNVNVKASTISNSIDVGFAVYLISFNLSSTFDFNLAKSSGSDIEIPFEVNRSSVVQGSTLKVEAFIDGTAAKLASSGADAVWDTIDTSSRINSSIKVKNTYNASTSQEPHKQHTLKLVATMLSGNTLFVSNILYYTFEIASQANDIINHFVNVGVAMPNNKAEFEDNKYLILRTTQYNTFSFDWSYYTDLILNEQSIPVTWALKREISEQPVYDTISSATGVKNKVNTFTFIPETSTSVGEDVRLVALYNNSEIGSWPIFIERSSLTISEASGYDLKLTAYGRSNSAPNKNVWRDNAHNINVTFSNGVSWDSVAGWDEDSFIAVGEDAYANVGYVPFPDNFGPLGRTIEIEFKSELVNDDDDVLIDIGSPSAGRITITPTKATVWLNGTEIVSTHYKANERIKLAFIFNKTVSGANNADGNLVYIVNNGILERAASIGATAAYPNINGIFKIGGSLSGIRVYTIRAYPIAISYSEAYNNFVYDSKDKVTIINRNNIVSGGSIVYEECAKKIDTILIEGDLSNLLDRNTEKDDSETTVTITRHCISDPSKDFIVRNGKIRKHGQSTLNYPITSMKIWFNKSATDDVNPTVTLSSLLTAMGLNKNRYIMKDGAIPSNKFVLQANYADSSGAKNGSLERLILDTWYWANIDGEFKLRTAPLLFASGNTITHNNTNLNETGANAWTEGLGSDTKGTNKTWTQLATKDFPYVIRNSADSFPCAVFYRNTVGGDTSIHFLGQYVFMDDKKSDHVFGERSIYHYYDETDPFCLKTENKDQDTKENRVWNNKDVVRIEVVLLDNVLTSYMNYNVPRSANDSINHGSTVPCDAIKYDDKGNPLNFYWEDYFEMIYPDPDDLEIKVNEVKVKEDKFANNSQFREKANKFLTFLQWITNIGLLNSTGNKIIGTHVTQAALNEFKNTACQHLDLYKLAAYYIFFLRFGLVDSVERNAQLKTYDGLHWHYEPWDMDIAIGDKNNGGFAFYPPMNRDTKLSTDASIYAYSGRSSSTSNVLWDCLEAWDYWRDTLVPKVAQALYDAGLTYGNIIQMFDKEYSEKWSEILYNESEHYKYVLARGNDNDWLAWMQGAGVGHRHWWLSKSMNYYDAMWTVGDFNNHRIYLAVTKDAHVAGTDLLTIKPTSDTFFKLTLGDGTSTLGTLPATKANPAVYDISLYTFNKKDPTHIYGATFIEELDLSCFAQKLETLTLTGAYDSVLGAPIKKLDIGIPTTTVSTTELSGYVSGTRLALSASDEQGDALGNIKQLNIVGQQSITNTDSLLYTNNRRTLTDLNAIGTGLTSFTSSRSGNKFNDIKLPACTIKSGVTTSSLNTIRMIDSSWNTLSFWTTNTTDQVVTETITYIEDGEEKTDTVIQANPATFTNTGIPASITLIELEGSTASNRCAADLVMGWLDSIATDVAAKNQSLSGAALEAKVLEVLADYKLDAENISWGTQLVPVLIYYQDLARLAALNNGNNQNAHLKGYICIADNEQLTSVLLTLIREWFGESVFNKSNINSGLIIDLQLGAEYIQINVGRDAYVENDNIYLQEGHTAILNATKFILSEDTNVNKIVGIHESELDETNTYWWSISSQTSGYGSRLSRGDDGAIRIVANESVIGDHIVTVTVTNGNTTKSVDIHIIGVTYPDDWVFNVRTINDAPRKFITSAAIAEDVFGDSRIYQLGSNSVLRDAYVMYNTNQDFEFYIEPVNGTGKTATFSNCTYLVYSVEDNQATLPWTSYTSSTLTGDGQTNTQLDLNDTCLWCNNSAIHQPYSGIVLCTKQTMPLTYRRYVINATVYIGGATVSKSLNILVMLDNNPIVSYSPNNLLYVTLRAKIDVNMQRALYKTDLMSISGTLAFTNGVSSLITNQIDGLVESIFKYLPYVETLDLSNCSFTAVDYNITSQDKRVLDLSNMKLLQTLNLTNAVITSNNTSDLTVDISNCPVIVSVLATGTSIGIKADGKDDNNNTHLDNFTTLSLGSPYYIYLENTLSLDPDNVSVTSDSNLTEVYIENVNRSETKVGFNIFNKIFGLS